MFPPDVNAIPRADLPAEVGRLTERLAWVVMRLNETAQAAANQPTKILDAKEAATAAGVAPRWLLQTTRGMSFRCDLSKKHARFLEPGFRSWLERRKR